MAEFINDNGKLIQIGEWRLSPDNRSFRYGDGCFETMRMIEGKIILEEYHFERLWSSLSTLKFQVFENLNTGKVSAEILQLAKKNNQTKNCRVRLTFYRGDGGLFDNINQQANYIIQTWAMADHPTWQNDQGLNVGIYRLAKKNCDTFSSIKTNNFLPYTMAAMWANEMKLNDAILLNAFDTIADSTIANVFIVDSGTVLTPKLSDGPINGVMRRYLLSCFKQEGMATHEISITEKELTQASEVFLTNSVFGLRSVKQIGNNKFSNQVSGFIFEKFVAPLFKI